MVKAPYSDRIEFWKFQHAAVTFGEVTKLCDLILKQKIDSSHPLHPCTMTGLHVLYGRPFKQRKEARISEDIVPQSHKKLHDALIQMRDQIYAHMDTDGPKTTTENSINKVGVFIRNSEARFALIMAFPRDLQIEKIKDLTNLLSDKAFYHAEKIWRKHFKNQSLPDGNYEVNLSKENDDFLKSISF